MKIFAALAALFVPAKPEGVRLGRYKVQDVAIMYRMATGYAGTVTRQHPVGIEPTLQDVNAPATGFGQPVAIDRTTQGVRALTAADVTDVVYGITVRVFPFQQQTGGMTANFGNALPLAGPIDVLKHGYILVPVNGTPAKGDPLFVWTAASSGNHVQGGFEATATAGSTIQVGTPKTFYYNGAPGADGLVEIAFNV